MADAVNGELDELVASTSTQDETDSLESEASPSEDRPSPGTSTDREASRTDPDTSTSTPDPAQTQDQDRLDREDGKTGDDDGLTPAERSVVDRLSPKPEEPAAKPLAQTHEKPKPGAGSADRTLTAEEEVALEPKTRKAFAGMRTENKALRAQLAELRPAAEEGTRLLAAFETHEAGDDLKEISETEHVGVVKIQAAMNRGLAAVQAGRDLAPADRRLLEQVIPAYDQQLEALGVRAPSRTLPEPYEGHLTEKHQLLIEGGFSEATVRQLIAIEDAEIRAKKAKDGSRETRRAAWTPPARTETASPQRNPAPAATARPGDTEGKKYAALNRAFLSERGIAQDEQSEHFTATLMPIIIKRLIKPSFPDKNATDLFNNARPETRHKLIVQAQDLIEADARKAAEGGRQRPPPAPSRARQPLSQRDTRGAGVHRRPAAPQGRDAEDEVVRRLDPQGRGLNDK